MGKCLWNERVDFIPFQPTVRRVEISEVSLPRERESGARERGASERNEQCEVNEQAVLANERKDEGMSQLVPYTYCLWL